jgi:predicted amidohydrolase
MVQSPIVWENKTINLRHFHNIIKQQAGKTDLAILPETFSTGFSMDVEAMAEYEHGETLYLLREWARNYGMAIAGSYIARAGIRSYFNRAFFITPDGEEYFYDKRHLFVMAGEKDHFSAGKKQMILNYLGWNICILICYDLRFPVWSRNVDNSYDLLIYVANWPEPRHSVWNILLPARAIENQAYVCGVNCICKDITGTRYLGGSALYSPKGEKIADCGSRSNFARTCTVDKEVLDTFRTRFPAWMDADKFSIHYGRH